MNVEVFLIFDLTGLKIESNVSLKSFSSYYFKMEGNNFVKIVSSAMELLFKLLDI